MNPTELAAFLHESREAAILHNEGVVPRYWYDYVYTPMTKKLVERFPELDTVAWSWSVATGEPWA